MKFPLHTSRAVLAASLALLSLSSACGVLRGTAKPDVSADAALTDLRSAPVVQPQARPEGLAGLSLPRPSEAPHATSVLPGDQSRVKDGLETMGFVQQHLSATTPASPFDFERLSDGVYDPLYIPNAATGLDGLAIGFYSFTGFINHTGPLKVTADWVGETPLGTTYIGLANPVEDRWVWFAQPASESFSVPEIQPYIFNPASIGEIKLLVLRLGVEASTLDCIVLGEAIDPNAQVYGDLDPDPANNTAPRTVNWTLYAQYAGAEFVNADWDVDGLPGYEITGNTDGLASFEYTQPGDYTVRAKLQDSLGGEHIAERSFTIVDPSNIAPVAVVASNVLSGSAPLEVTLDASLSSDIDGEIIRYRWDVDADGEWDFDTGDVPTLDYGYGPVGQNFYVVEVMDNNFALDTASGFVTVNAGWNVVMIDSNVDVLGLSVTTTDDSSDSRPVVAYQVDHSGDPGTEMRVAVATALDGSTWSAPQPLVSSTTKHRGEDPALVKLADDRPLLFYGEEDAVGGTWNLFAVRADTTAATNWSFPIEVETGLDCGRINTAALVDGFPVVVTVEGVGNLPEPKVQYIRASNADASTGWASPELVGSSSTPISAVSILQAEDGTGLPLVAYETADGISSQVHLTTGDTVAGDAWTPRKTFSTGQVNFLSMMSLDAGDILLLASQGGTGSTVRCATASVDGTTWPSAFTNLTPNDYPSGGASHCALVSKTGMAVFRSVENSDLMYMESLDDQASEWSKPYAVWSIGDTGQHCQMLNSNSTAVIVFYDKESRQLMSAYYD